MAFQFYNSQFVVGLRYTGFCIDLLEEISKVNNWNNSCQTILQEFLLFLQCDVSKVSKYVLIKYNKTYIIKCFRRKYLKPSKIAGCGDISPNAKKKEKKARKRKVTYFLLTLHVNITGGGLLSVMRIKNQFW